ncbi:hypothetical protein AVEN_256724-1 [Araneus ventricosus]|uniref:EGF-like domain-containing protein n=1 Tax=Araneus ventricosus TaxID=182803 RepID=A0A4Y2FQT1_ARAVE|nr:hypothetical protein AVEN_256724-1 [Araneus ventricosus]
MTPSLNMPERLRRMNSRWPSDDFLFPKLNEHLPGTRFSSEACVCKNGNCVNEGGKHICKCDPGYGNSRGTSCKACECGPDSNCTFSGLFQQKKCICKPGYFAVDGKCVACVSICKNGNCVNEGGKQICKCNPGFGNFVETTCIGI